MSPRNGNPIEMIHGGFDGLLQNELQLLSNEAKRKFSAVKEVRVRLQQFISRVEN
jgi:hypothetical protein